MGDDYIERARRLLADYEPRALDLPPTAREAAVLLLLYGHEGEEGVVLTVRTDTVEHHKSQISFPGGGHDPEDVDLTATALREAWEEVGVHPDDVEIIGRLDDAFTVSNFRVAPFVGVLRRWPYAYAPSPIEVAEVLEVPLRHLLDPATRVEEMRRLEDGRTYVGPAYYYHHHRIWGATARMLEEFLDLLQGGTAALRAHPPVTDVPDETAEV